MNNAHKLNVNEMFETACDFYYCANLCRTTPYEDKHDIKVLIVPEAVNYAFSCEIFLKLLLYLNDIPFKMKHNLEELFNDLPEKHRALLTKQCEEEYKNDSEMFSMDFISNISNSFEEWRYCYERNTDFLRIGFLYIFAKKLKEICANEILQKRFLSAFKINKVVRK